MITLALAIPTVSSWTPGRKETLTKLKDQLGLVAFPDRERFGPRFYLEHDNKSSRREWSEFIWWWGCEQAANTMTPATHFLQLQDDLEVPPFFWTALYAMIEARPSQVLCLQSAHQAGPELAKQGFHGYTTIDGLLGPAYVLPTEVLAEFMLWRQSHVLEGGLDAVPEDTLLGTFCMVTGKRIWSPLPSIVDHPCQVASTYGNDKAQRQRSTVRWNLPPDKAPDLNDTLVEMAWREESLCSSEFWAKEAKHLGRFYDVVPSIARRYVKGYTAADYQKHMAEELYADAPPCCFCGKKEAGVVSRQTGLLLCGICLRGISPMIGARFAKPGTPCIIVATPLKDKPHPVHADAICQIRADESLNVDSPYEIAQWHQPSDDLVRVRSRIVRDVVNLKRQSGKPVTHLWLVDGDVAPTTTVLHRMLQAKKPFVTAPYPARVLDWRGVDKPDGRTGEARAYVYNIEALPGGVQQIDATGCTEIASIGLGCALIEIGLLERMVDHYGQEPHAPPYAALAERFLTTGTHPNENIESRLELANTCAEEMANLAKLLEEMYELGQTAHSLVFDDTPFPGMPSKETVALFQLELADRKLQSEDRSFCRRVRAMGEKVWMYVGPGSPVDHFGDAKYRGMIESLDIRALPAGKAAE